MTQNNLKEVDIVNVEFSEELENYRGQAKEWLNLTLPEWWHNYKERIENEERYNNFKNCTKNWYREDIQGFPGQKSMVDKVKAF